MKNWKNFIEKWTRIFLAILIYILIPSVLAITIMAALIFYYIKLLK